MHVEPHHTAEQLAGMTRAEARAKRARRLSAVRLALLGQTAAAITGQVLRSERQVRTWVARYNAEGLAGLDDLKGRGRQGPLTRTHLASPATVAASAVAGFITDARRAG